MLRDSVGGYQFYWEVIMKGKIWILIVFILSYVTLLISLKLFWNMGIYVDEYNSSPSRVYGSEFWLYMAWIRIILLALMTFILGIKLIRK